MRAPPVRAAVASAGSVRVRALLLYGSCMTAGRVQAVHSAGGRRYPGHNEASARQQADPHQSFAGDRC